MSSSQLVFSEFAILVIGIILYKFRFQTKYTIYLNFRRLLLKLLMVLLRAFLVYESGKEILTCFNNVIKLVPISAVTNVLLLLMINPKVINKTISEFIIS